MLTATVSSLLCCRRSRPKTSDASSTRALTQDRTLILLGTVDVTLQDKSIAVVVEHLGLRHSASITPSLWSRAWPNSRCQVRVRSTGEADVWCLPGAFVGCRSGEGTRGGRVHVPAAPHGDA